MKASILAIETSTSQCSVALRTRQGDFYERSDLGATVHSTVLLPRIKEVLEESQLSLSELDLIAVSKGPGSFTGLRIGVGVAQGLAYGAKLPMFGGISVNALMCQDLLLCKELADRDYIVAIDARMNEVYWAHLQFKKHDSSITEIQKVNVSGPEKLLGYLLSTKEGSNAKLLGNAWSAYPELGQYFINNFGALEGQPLDTQLPHAKGLIALFDTQLGAKANFSHLVEDALAFRPMYVRDNVAKKSEKVR